jgi:hypothetical protein
VLYIKEGAFVSLMLAAGTLSLVFEVVKDCVVFDDCAAMARRPPIYSAVFIMIALLFIMKRRRFIAVALSSVAEDRAIRDAAWLCLLQDPATAGDLAKVRDVVDVIVRFTPSSPHRQYNRKRMEAVPRPLLAKLGSEASIFALPWSTAHLPILGRTVSTDEVCGPAVPELSWPVLVEGLEGCDESAPVASVDQLYSQAVAVAAELDALCRDWAATSDGELVGGRVTFDGGFEELVSVGLVKRPERAAAKVLACYGGDPSRLLDVCRRRIAFGRVAELGACLGRMGADSGVRVVRVKNLLREDADPRVTAGFRVRGLGWLGRWKVGFLKTNCTCQP